MFSNIVSHKFDEKKEKYNFSPGYQQRVEIKMRDKTGIRFTSQISYSQYMIDITLIENGLFAYPTEAPGATGPVGPMTTNLPSLLTADRIIPCDSIPIILRGSKLAMKHISLPTSTDGSS